jgi:hypothetical protein
VQVGQDVRDVLLEEEMIDNWVVNAFGSPYEKDSIAKWMADGADISSRAVPFYGRNILRRILQRPKYWTVTYTWEKKPVKPQRTLAVRMEYNSRSKGEVPVVYDRETGQDISCVTACSIDHRRNGPSLVSMTFLLLGDKENS